MFAIFRVPLFLLLLSVLPGAAAAAAVFDTAAKAAILIDYRTGQVLFEKNADEPRPPASMSKLMTAYLVFERLREGSLSLEDELPVSEKAWRTGGSRTFVQVGTRVKVADLLRGMIVQSGNDASVVLAEALAGSERAFAELMNAKAAELGLTNSHFVNATGLPDPEHYMSVRDLAILARRIIREFPEYFAFYSQREFTYNNIRQFNRNPLLRKKVPGVDGMKTGYTKEAGFGLVATAEREGRRLILVVAGLESARERAIEAERLLEFGFREFREYRLFEPGAPVVEADVWLGEADKVPLVSRELVAVTLSRQARDGLEVRVRYDNPVPAPVSEGQVLGELVITAPDIEPITVPLVAGRDVAKAGMLGRIMGALTYLVGGAS
ncbi:MAG TPA: D-alanyl-D-alanine carboxypeptidase [Rhodospirillales bacterium]|nr:D-alanyl-D-alanine carboxypeptidase [Rhodospirillales bacterium]